MISRPKEVWYPGQQREIIQITTTVTAYQELHNTLFSSQSAYFFNDEVARIPRLQGPNTLRLLALHGFLTAQVGYESCMGLVARHRKRGFERNRYTLEHLVASVIYMAGSNLAYADKKEAWKDQLKGNYEAVVGVNNFYIKNSNGSGEVNIDFDEMLMESNRRFRDPKPIFVPDRELSSQLAAVEFSSDKADKIDGEKFLSEVYPRFAEVVINLLDPEALVVESNLRDIVVSPKQAQMVQGNLF